MYDAQGKLADTLALIPDSSYAASTRPCSTIAQTRAFDPKTMARADWLDGAGREEYGSHNKTFQIASAGSVRVTDAAVRCCSSIRSSPAISGAPARPKTCRARLVKLAVNRRA